MVVFIGGDVELLSFSVEDGCESGDFYFFIFYIFGSVDGEDIHGICGDDFEVVCQGCNFCHRNSDSQASEAAWAGGDVDVGQVIDVFVEAFKYGVGGGKKLGTVGHNA